MADVIDLGAERDRQDGIMPAGVADLNYIVSHIDEERGHAAALRAYILALRDLQHANDKYAMLGGDAGEIDAAQHRVCLAFGRLATAQMLLSADW
jgi:hypothetical protein